jgi:hypothetical protein
MKWDPQREEWVEEYAPFEREDPLAPARGVIIGCLVSLALIAAVVVAVLNVGEGPGPERPASASVGPLPSPSIVELGGSPVRADAMTESLLIAYLRGGAESIEFVRADLQRMTGCAIAGELNADWTRKDLRVKASDVRDLYPSSEVGTARAGGYSMVAVFVCE